MDGGPAAGAAPDAQPASAAARLPPRLSKLVHAWALVLPGKLEVRSLHTPNI